LALVARRSKLTFRGATKKRKTGQNRNFLFVAR
jgi:hypothetical protein